MLGQTSTLVHGMWLEGTPLKIKKIKSVRREKY